MASSKYPAESKSNDEIVLERLIGNATFDVFPYPDIKEFRGHGFFMKVLGEQDNCRHISTTNYQIDMEDGENLLESIEIKLSNVELVQSRKKDLVYEDHFNKSVLNMIGERKFSYGRLVNVCKKYENQAELREHINRSNETWQTFEKNLDEDDARASAFAIAFYTGSQAYGINRSASVIARKSNGEAFGMVKQGDLEDASIILYYLVRGLAHIPYYWGVTARAVQLKEVEFGVYVPGSLITWLQFSSSMKGHRPPKHFSKDRNTNFIIYSITGRSIQEFSIFPEEDEILFLPHSTFLVLNHEQDEDKHLIYLRQIELGLCQFSVLWVDDHIFDPNWENKEHMQRASTRSLNGNVHFIPKSTTEYALSFLRSPFGQRLKNCSRFRIVTDMRRDNEPSPRFAGIRLVKHVRELGFENQCLIFTGYQEKALEKVRAELTKSERKNLSVTEYSEELHRFVGFEEEE